MRISAFFIAFAACFLTAGVLSAQDAPCGEGCMLTDFDYYMCYPGGGGEANCQGGSGGCAGWGSCDTAVTMDGSVSDPYGHYAVRTVEHMEGSERPGGTWSTNELWIRYT